MAEQTIQAAGDAVITVNGVGVITSWNPAAERLLGHSADDAVGQTLALIIPEAYRDRHIPGFRAAMSARQLAHDGQPARVEGIASTGKTIPLVMSLGLIREEDESVVGVVAILRRDAAPISFI